MPQSVERRDTQLKIVDPTDGPWLAEVTSEPALGYRWRPHNAGLLSSEPCSPSWWSAMWEGVFTQYIVVQRSGEDVTRRAFVQFFDFDPLSMSLQLGVAFEVDCADLDDVADGLRMSLEHLFKRWPVRRVVLQGPRAVVRSLSALRIGPRPMTICATLQRHDWYMGTISDYQIAIIDRNAV